MEIDMDRDGLGSAFLRVELLRRQLLRPHFIELGLTVGQGQPRSDEPAGACRPVCA